MAPFVTAEEYQAWAGTVEEAQRLEVALEAACDEIRRYTCQQIDLVAGDVVSLVGSGTRVLLLPELPVVSVASVVDGDGTAVDAWVLRAGMLYRPSGWPAGALYTVTYDHGWADVPGDIKMAAFRLTQDLYNAVGSSGEIRQESIGNYSVTYAANGEAGFGSPLAALDRRVVKQVPVP